MSAKIETTSCLTFVITADEASPAEIKLAITLLLCLLDSREQTDKQAERLSCGTEARLDRKVDDARERLGHDEARPS